MNTIDETTNLSCMKMSENLFKVEFLDIISDFDLLQQCFPKILNFWKKYKLNLFFPKNTKILEQFIIFK